MRCFQELGAAPFNRAVPSLSPTCSGTLQPCRSSFCPSSRPASASALACAPPEPAPNHCPGSFLTVGSRSWSICYTGEEWRVLSQTFAGGPPASPRPVLLLYFQHCTSHRLLFPHVHTSLVYCLLPSASRFQNVLFLTAWALVYPTPSIIPRAQH